MPHFLSIITLILLAFLAPATLASSPGLYVDGLTDDIKLIFYTERYLDPTGETDFRSIEQRQLFEPVLDPGQLHLGYYDGTLWLKNVITNTTDNSLLKVFSFDYANLDRVDVYVVDERGELRQQFRSGSHITKEQRPLNNRHASFPIAFPANTAMTLYTRIQSNGSLTAFQRLYSPTHYDNSYSYELFWLSLYCGMLLALSLYNLLLFTALKQSVFLRYSLFVASFLAGTLAMNGLGPQLFWDHDTLDVNRVMAFSFSTAGFTATLFARKFLALKTHSRWWYRVTLIPLTVSFLGMLSAFIASPQTALQLSDINGLTAGLVLLSCGVACAIRKVPGANLFVVAWTLLLTGAFVHALRNLGVVPTNFFSLYGMQIGSAIEMLLLSFAIAAKFNQLKNEQQRAQDEALTTLKTHEAKLEKKVAQRTYELEQMAHHDGLTGLLNRNGLHQALRDTMQRCRQSGTPLTLVMLDLDAFKPINDEYGHTVGDRVLKIVAERLLGCTVDGDTVARFGGDEFLIVSDRFANNLEVSTFIDQVRRAIQHPMAAGVSQSLTISASVGFHQTALPCSVNELLKEAEQAMYRVKYRQRGKPLPY